MNKNQNHSAPIMGIFLGMSDEGSPIYKTFHPDKVLPPPSQKEPDIFKYTPESPQKNSLPAIEEE